MPAVRFRYGCLVALLAISVAACSSSGGGRNNTSSTNGDKAVPATTPTSAAAGTKGAFITQADLVCANSQTQVMEAVRQIDQGQTTTAQKAEAYVQQVVPILKQETANLRNLTPPAADKAAVAKLWDEYDRATDATAAALRADPAKAGNTNFDPYAAVNKKLQDYGLVGCGGT